MQWLDTPLEGKRVVVVGLGASGLAAARLCAHRKASVVATDEKSCDALGENARTLAEVPGVTLVLGGHEAAGIPEADLVVVSPGVSTFAELEEAERRGVPVIGEVELSTGALLHPAPVIAVGGTKGKSTTTSLIGAFLEAHGLATFVGGNLGEPLAAHAHEYFDAVVLEVSSFQMERVQEFKPKVSILVNIADDHLERHLTFESYARAKGNAFAKQTAEDVAIVPYGDAACLEQAHRGKGKLVEFGRGGSVEVTPEAIVDQENGARYARQEIALFGGHMARNAAAAIAAVRPFAVDPSTIRRVLRAFRGLPHRLVPVSKVAGVWYYDDSAATNVGAAATVMHEVPEPRVVLIAGGHHKGGSWAPLVAALRAKGRAVVVIGEAAEMLADVTGTLIPVHRARTMDDAVVASAALAHPGDAVLLAPACSPFDMYRDPWHRGDEFVRAVHALTEFRPEVTSPALWAAQ